MPITTHRTIAVIQSSLALLILVQCEKSQPVTENQPVQIPTAVQSQLDARVADPKKVEPPTPLESTDNGSTLMKSGDANAADELKPEVPLPELTADQFSRFEMNVGLMKIEPERGKVYQVIGSVMQVGNDFIQIDDSNSILSEAEPYAIIRVNPEFLEDFSGMKGTGVRFLAEFAGYGNFRTVAGNNLRLVIFNASYYAPLHGDKVRVVDKNLAQKVFAMLPQATSEGQNKADESKNQPMTAGDSKPREQMPDGPSNSVGTSTSAGADSIKIKIAELKGELAVIDSKIDTERKRWKDASDLINAITNNGTQPVIRNSPEHVRMYEAQVIMKDVEGKAPGLKEQKARVEAALKALE